MFRSAKFAHEARKAPDPRQFGVIQARRIAVDGFDSGDQYHNTLRQSTQSTDRGHRRRLRNANPATKPDGNSYEPTGFLYTPRMARSASGRVMPLLELLCYLRKEQDYAMLLKITLKRHVTFPAHVLYAMGVGPGDRLQLIPGPDGYLLRPRRIDYSRLGTLREKILRGHPSFDIRAFREQPYNPALRV